MMIWLAKSGQMASSLIRLRRQMGVKQGRQQSPRHPTFPMHRWSEDTARTVNTWVGMHHCSSPELLGLGRLLASTNVIGADVD